MLYGNLIFIKKTGGDGSKYPVTERDIKIGRSEKCLIRIYNPHVALEHCQLIIEDNGQATLRNLSNQSILNGKPLNSGDVTLCHGDIFKLGERLARWEYLPTSKFYKQLLSPTGRLVAVVMPQQRSLEDQATPGTSASEISVLKNTTLGKRRFSERAISESSSSGKIRKSNGSELLHKSKEDLQKLLNSPQILKSTKWVLKGKKVKERKSISGIVGSKTSKGKVGEKSRKSTLPSWKVNIVSPSERKSSGNRNSLVKSNQKSAKSPKSTVQILLKDMIESEPEKLLLSNSKTDMKEPQKIILKSKSLDDSGKTVLKKSIMIEKGLPINFSERFTRSTYSLSQSLENATLKSPSDVVSSTPSHNSALKFGRLVHSENKFISKKHPVFFKGKRKMSFILNKMDSTPSKNLSKRRLQQEKAKTPKVEISNVSGGIVLTSVKNNEAVLTKKKEIPHKSLNNTLIKSTSKESKKTPRENIVDKTLKNPDVKTSRKSVIIKTPRSLTKKQSQTSRISILGKVALDTVSQTHPLIDLDDTPSPKKRKLYHRKSVTAKSLVSKETPIKLMKSFGKTELLSSDQKIQNEAISVFSSPIDKNFNFSAENSAQTLTFPRNRNSLIITSRAMNSLKKGGVFSRGGQRKLSPSSSAERAAKKLKTSCPKKPDKNKKAALLVLGKANRKQQVSQNVKVLLRQKILKKAIKQSTAVSALDDKNGIQTANKLKKGPGKNIAELKSKKFIKKNISSENCLPIKYLKMSGETDRKSPTEEKAQEGTPKSKKILATNVFQTSPCLSTDAAVQSVSKQIKQSEFSHSNNSVSFMEKTNLPSSIEKSAENYFFNSNRRCSKRLSYKNDTGRPDFIELSPTALGLMPKNIEIFKTPKDNKRRSSNLVTPKNVQTTGIIKSASTSKIGNRKSVRFSSKDVSINSGFCSPNISERIDFNFSPFDTPNITVDVFVSPLIDQSAVLKQNLNDSKVTPEVEEIADNSTKNRKCNSVPKTCVRKLKSPFFKKKLNKIFSNSSEPLRNSLATISSLSSIKVEKQSKASDENKSRKSDLSDLMGSRHLFSTPENQKNQRNNLSDLTGISRLLRTPKDINSPKNDLTDVKGVNKLMRTPRVQKSPKNDLTDVKGVKKLMRTPRVQKSPKNDLTDVKGVKKLMRTPRVQKSPKNDLTDVKGVKKLMRTPRVQKSPKNDLTDVKGVKKLMRTPRVQKSPKNDLTDVKGVKKLMRTPRVQKSPKNDLTDIAGVKELLRSPQIQKKSKNELSDLRKIKNLFGSPKLQKSPKNDLTDVTGVKKLFKTPFCQKSFRNSLLEVREIKKPFRSSAVQELSENFVENARALFSESEKSVNTPLTNLEISKSSKSILESKENVTRKPNVKDFRAIRGRRTIHSRSKTPKNDLSDVTGVRELFSRHKPTSDYDISLTGVAELFEFPKTEVAFEQKIKSRKKIVPESVQKVSKTRTLRSKKVLKNEVETKLSTRLRLSKAVKDETEKKRTRSKKLEDIMNLEEEKSIKRKNLKKMKTNRNKKSSDVVKKSQKVAQKNAKTSGKKSLTKAKVECLEENQSRVGGSRKRKIVLEDVISPPKLRRKLPASEKSTSNEIVESPKKVISRSRARRTTRNETSLKSGKKVPVRVSNSETVTATSKVQLEAAIKIGTKQIQKVQNKRSQTKSKKNVKNNEKKESPRKTRGNKATTATKKVSRTRTKSIENKSVRSTARKCKSREKSPPVVRRSARRK